MNKRILSLTALYLSALASASAKPMPPGPQRPADSTVLITLGTRGGPLPTADRSQSANLLVVNGALYLIDAGDNVTRRIVQSGHDFKAVDKVFLTHAHGDHTAGLVTLLGAAWDYQRRTPIDVFGSGADRVVSGALAFLAISAEIRSSTGKNTPLADIVRAQEVRSGLLYEDANVKVYAAENSHFEFEPSSPLAGRYRSFSYRFETPQRVIVFTGDTGPSAAVTELAKGADLLVSEIGDPDAVIAAQKKSGVWAKKTEAERQGLERHLRKRHLSADDVGKMATEAGVKRVILTHLVPTVNPRDRYQRYVAMVRRSYKGPVEVASDLHRF